MRPYFLADWLVRLVGGLHEFFEDLTFGRQSHRAQLYRQNDKHVRFLG